MRADIFLDFVSRSGQGLIFRDGSSGGGAQCGVCTQAGTVEWPLSGQTLGVADPEGRGVFQVGLDKMVGGGGQGSQASALGSRQGAPVPKEGVPGGAAC